MAEINHHEGVIAVATTIYRSRLIAKISQTKTLIDELNKKYYNDTTLKIIGALVINHMEFIGKALDAWYAGGIKKRYDAKTISDGKSVCMGHIDAMLSLVKSIRDELKKPHR